MGFWKKTGKILSGRLALNVYVWLILLDVLYNNNREYAKTHSPVYLWHIGGMLLLLWITIYGYTAWLLPYFLARKKYWRALPAALLWLVPFTLIIAHYSEWLIHAFPGTEKHFYSPISLQDKAWAGDWWTYYANIYIDLGFTVFIFTVAFLARYSFRERRLRDELQQRQIASELSMLKSQINPHFLFNVLNSIYSLSLKKSDDAPRIILQVSDILRYMLYESKNELMPLEQELQILQDYVDIEKVRLAQSSTISMHTRGQLTGYRIPPALLLAFVENAIKHGIDSMAQHAFLDINIVVDPSKDMLYFHCFNNYKARVYKKEGTGGIGLENTRRRLELIYGPAHNLVITDNNETFDVKLEINLSKHELPDH